MLRLWAAVARVCMRRGGHTSRVKKYFFCLKHDFGTKSGTFWQHYRGKAPCITDKTVSSTKQPHQVSSLVGEARDGARLPLERRGQSLVRRLWWWCRSVCTHGRERARGAALARPAQPEQPSRRRLDPPAHTRVRKRKSNTRPQRRPTDWNIDDTLMRPVRPRAPTCGCVRLYMWRLRSAVATTARGYDTSIAYTRSGSLAAWSRSVRQVGG
jgi:hypothetical protein